MKGIFLQAKKSQKRGESKATPKSTEPSRTRSVVGSCSAKVKQSKGKDVLCCAGCGTIITDEVRALQCDRCGDADSKGNWKCTDCLGLKAEVYAVLGDGVPLKWFCDGCEEELGELEALVQERGKADKLFDLVNRVMEKLVSLEEMMDEKASNESVIKSKEKILGLEERLNKRLDELSRQVNHKVNSSQLCPDKIEVSSDWRAKWTH